MGLILVLEIYFLISDQCKISNHIQVKHVSSASYSSKPYVLTKWVSYMNSVSRLSARLRRSPLLSYNIMHTTYIPAFFYLLNFVIVMGLKDAFCLGQSAHSMPVKKQG